MVYLNNFDICAYCDDNYEGGINVRCQRPESCRVFVVVALWIGLAVGSTSVGHADPNGGPAPNPYPSFEFMMRSYDRHEPDEFFTATQNFTASGNVLWFQAPGDLNCAIWDRGSFGCTGDIRGAPPGTTHIGWVNGNLVVRHDPQLGSQFPPGQAARPLPPRSYVSYLGTTCGVTPDSSTYCVRGPYRFLITPTRTWLSPP